MTKAARRMFALVAVVALVAVGVVVFVKTKLTGESGNPAAVEARDGSRVGTGAMTRTETAGALEQLTDGLQALKDTANEVRGIFASR